jgi:hypothetical protein
MKNIHHTLQQLSWVTCVAAVFLIAAPAVSAGDFSPYNTYDPGLYSAVSQAFLGPPVVTGDPGYIPLSQFYGGFIQPVIAIPNVIPVSPAIINPSTIIGDSAYIPGAFYAGSVSTGSSYSGSSSVSGNSGYRWDDWFRIPKTGGMCGL